MTKIKTISGIGDIYKNYDVFILDQWGVMHDGNIGYSHAIECIKQLFTNNKKLIIISNSSKKKETTVSRLPELGFNKIYFNEIMTSGEMIWQSLVNKNDEETMNLGEKGFHIYDESKEDGKNFLDGLDKFNFVDMIDQADFILGCTPFANKEVIDYIPLLNIAKKKNLPFICANPDFDTVENHSGKLTICMGTIAELYRNMGGKTFILGKPSIEIYKKSTNKILNLDHSRILAVGDSIHHDIKGAINFGIDSLLITSTGIHRKSFDKTKPSWENVMNKLKNLAINPTFICSEFKF